MRAMFFLLFIAYVGGNIYLFIRALQAMGALPIWGKVIFGLLFWVVALSLFISFALRDSAVPEVLLQWIYRIGTSWMVVVLYMVMFLVICDLIRLFVPSFSSGFLISLSLTLITLGAGYINYRNPRIEHIDISLDKPLGVKQMKIVALSDVHIGYGTGKGSLARYVAMIMEQQPDMILIAGDLIDNSIRPVENERMEEELNRLHAPLGVYMAAGNHEFISGIESCQEFLAKTPIILLRDSVVAPTDHVRLICRDDRSNRHRKSLAELIAPIDDSQTTILLDHQPYNLSTTDSLRIDLQISGHTHRGQIFPLNLLVDRMYEQSHGYRRWRHSHIYVSSGLSLWGPPFRIGTHSDMAVITLRGRE